MPAQGLGDDREPTPVPPRTRGGRHRKRKTGLSRAHLTATALAAGVVVAVGQPLLAGQQAPEAEDPVRDVLRLSFSTEPAAEKVRSYPTLIPARSRTEIPESRKLELTAEVQERLRRKAAEAEQARLAAEQRIAQEAAAREAAAREAAAREAAARDAAAREAAAREAAAKEAARKEAARRATGWVKPTSGRFTSGFGARWGTTHYGVDIANRIGTPIVSAAAGTVIDAGAASGFGLWVRVQHNDGTITVYGHVNEILVREGAKVGAGQQIATMGNRGQSTGPHLHFEVWVGGSRKVDPVAWMAQRGVSLR